VELTVETMENRNEKSYMRARKKVERLKGFYIHLAWYVGVNLLLIGLRLYVIATQQTAPGDAHFQNWLDWNIFLTPVLWGIAVGIHALIVFKSSWNPLATWEERKIREYMERDSEHN
jgi:hypothetical protein